MFEYYPDWAKKNVALYLELLKYQNFGCGICEEQSKPLVIDHDHKTNLIRGLLCHKCNTTFERPERKSQGPLEGRIRAYLIRPPASMINLDGEIAEVLVEARKSFEASWLPEPLVAHVSGDPVPSSKKPPTKAQEILQRTSNLLNEIKIASKKKRKKETYNGQGYVYTYDSEGKPIPKSRVLMEEKLGRPLHKFEVIVYLDGDRRNCELENLATGLKQNSPLSRLRCNHCGTVGDLTFLLDGEQEHPDR